MSGVPGRAGGVAGRALAGLAPLGVRVEHVVVVHGEIVAPVAQVHAAGHPVGERVGDVPVLQLVVVVAEADFHLLPAGVVEHPGQRAGRGGAGDRGRQERGERGRGGVGQRRGQVAVGGGAARRALEVERALEVGEAIRLGRGGHGHLRAVQRAAVDGGVRPHVARGVQVGVDLAHGERGLVVGQRALLVRGKLGGRVIRQHHALEVADRRAVAQRAGQERAGDGGPGRVAQVDHRGRHALGREFLLDRLDPGGAIAEDEHVHVDARASGRRGGQADPGGPRLADPRARDQHNCAGRQQTSGHNSDRGPQSPGGFHRFSCSCVNFGPAWPSRGYAQAGPSPPTRARGASRRPVADPCAAMLSWPPSRPPGAPGAGARRGCAGTGRLSG